MPSSMAQQEQSGGGGGGGGGGGPGSGGGGGGGGVRRRSLESPMKESQARTKVVLRHLPPSISEAVLLEHIDSKFAGCYTWFSFRPGKASVKRQVPARAYINFKKPEDVYDFSEHLDGHVFVNEKGTQYKVAVEYAPYQRTPKPRSKKDIREGSITKDPDYLEFLEMLGKPLEYLPSAEVQLERREAEKAAALGAGGGKETVITPLMEFVRQRRAAKSAPQRLSTKMVPRSGGVSVATSNSASHKRALERSRPGSQMDFKEVQARDHTGGQRREEHRKEREVVIERRRKELTEAKERKLLHGEAASTGVSGMKGNATTCQLAESSKENAHVAVLCKDSLAPGTDGESAATEGLAVEVEPLSSHSPAATVKFANEAVVGDGAKDPKREVLKRKQLSVMREKLHKDSEWGPTSPGQVSVSGSYNQRHRPPVSPRVTSASTQPQLATSGEGSAGAAPSKPSQRREVSGRNSSRGGSPRDQQSPHVTLLQDSCSQQQGSPQPVDRVGKRPPRPQNVRISGKEQSPSLASSGESDQAASLSSNSTPAEEKSDSFPASDRQDSRRVRNKDRPDRPVWTPRRRSDTAQNTDASSSVSSAAPVSSEEKSETSKLEKSEKGLHRQVGKALSISGQNSAVESKGADGAAGQHADGGGRSPLGSGPQVGKVRHVESGSTRSPRSARSALSGSNATANQEHSGVTNQGAEHRSDSSVSVDPKAPQISLYNTRENGESHTSSVGDKEKRKQDAPQWNESTGGSHRSGERRRERSGQHISRDGDGTVVTTELSKPVKRGGSLALGGNEKQVWVAVQKSGSGT
ncbi:unnamed protein product [Calypogeia fissa]